VIFNCLSIFPEFFGPATDMGLIGKAKSSGKIEVRVLNPRDFTDDVHQTVDDRPFGGGDGMVMMVDPLLRAVESLGDTRGELILLSPAGRPLTTDLSLELSEKAAITLVCGRYAGVDQRWVDLTGATEVSVGDYVLSGGEPAALCLLDSVTRLLPGVLGHPASAREDSHFNGLLESPCYTRPQQVAGYRVPDVLLSGDHAKIEQVRLWMSLLRTASVRPELIDSRHQQEYNRARQWFQALSEEDKKGLALSLVEAEE